MERKKKNWLGTIEQRYTDFHFIYEKDKREQEKYILFSHLKK